MGSNAHLFTIGHSTRTAEELFTLLVDNGVELLVDIRRTPFSRRHPHFDREELARSSAAHGLRYRHVEALGGRREPSTASKNLGVPDGAFRGYADHVATEGFRAAAEEVVLEARRVRLALMCAEARPSECHRRLLADWLVAHGHAVVHIVGPDESEPHAIDPCVVRDERGVLVWRARQATLFD